MLISRCRAISNYVYTRLVKLQRPCRRHALFPAGATTWWQSTGRGSASCSSGCRRPGTATCHRSRCRYHQHRPTTASTAEIVGRPVAVFVLLPGITGLEGAFAKPAHPIHEGGIDIVLRDEIDALEDIALVGGARCGGQIASGQCRGRPRSESRPLKRTERPEGRSLTFHSCQPRCGYHLKFTDAAIICAV